MIPKLRVTLSKMQLFNWHLHAEHHLKRSETECVFCSGDLFKIGTTLRRLGYPVRKISSDHIELEGTSSVDAQSRGLDSDEEVALFKLISGSKRLPRRKSPERLIKQQKMLKRESLMGIYKIECLVHHKTYIGKSTDIHRRWKAHIDALNQGIHNNLGLQADWSLHGPNEFSFEIIELCTKESALQTKEFVWISYFNSKVTPFGYNLTPGGIAEYQVYQDMKRLTDEDLFAIRKSLQRVQQQKNEIADRFNITPLTLSRIASGKLNK